MAFMLSVTNKPFVLTVAMLNAAMLSVVVPYLRLSLSLSLYIYIFVCVCVCVCVCVWREREREREA